MVLGDYEPNETECEWNYDEEGDEEENQVKIEEVNEKSGEVKDETSNSETVCFGFMLVEWPPLSS